MKNAIAYSLMGLKKRTLKHVSHSAAFLGGILEPLSNKACHRPKRNCIRGAGKGVGCVASRPKGIKSLRLRRFRVCRCVQVSRLYADV